MISKREQRSHTLHTRMCTREATKNFSKVVNMGINVACWYFQMPCLSSFNRITPGIFLCQRNEILSTIIYKLVHIKQKGFRNI